jgi:Flp pilus assembly protein TadG
MNSTGPSSQRDRGAAMVELALLLPILFTVMFAIIGFGIAYSEKISIQGAAREGARELALGKTTDEAKARVVESAGGTDVTYGTIRECAVGDTTGSSLMTVQATVEINAILFTKTINLESTASMRCGV